MVFLLAVLAARAQMTVLAYVTFHITIDTDVALHSLQLCVNTLLPPRIAEPHRSQVMVLPRPNGVFVVDSTRLEGREVR